MTSFMDLDPISITPTRIFYSFIVVIGFNSSFGKVTPFYTVFRLFARYISPVRASGKRRVRRILRGLNTDFTRKCLKSSVKDRPPRRPARSNGAGRIAEEISKSRTVKVRAVIAASVFAGIFNTTCVSVRFCQAAGLMRMVAAVD